MSATGLEHEGEAARRRFVVYWVRPALAALAVGVFTFFIVSVPGEKEKIELRASLQKARQEADVYRARADALAPLARTFTAERLVTHDAGSGQGPWMRLAFDPGDGRGVVLVKRIDAESGQRAFAWWNRDGERTPLAAIDLKDGAGRAEVRIPDGDGTVELTIEATSGEPSPASPAVLAITLDRD